MEAEEEHHHRDQQIKESLSWRFLAMDGCNKLEDLESITWADKNAADIECANQGTISKKEAFIWWALPLHRQRLEDEQE